MARIPAVCLKCGKVDSVDPVDVFGQDVPEEEAKHTMIGYLCFECRKEIKQN